MGIIQLALGGAIGFYVGKVFLGSNFKKSARPGTEELVDELDQLSESILAAGDSNLDIIKLLIARDQQKLAKLLLDSTRDMLLPVLIKEYQLAQSQGLLGSLDMPTRNIYGRNEKVDRILFSLNELGKEMETQPLE